MNVRNQLARGPSAPRPHEIRPRQLRRFIPPAQIRHMAARAIRLISQAPGLRRAGLTRKLRNTGNAYNQPPAPKASRTMHWCISYPNRFRPALRAHLPWHRHARRSGNHRDYFTCSCADIHSGSLSRSDRRPSAERLYRYVAPGPSANPIYLPGSPNLPSIVAIARDRPIKSTFLTAVGSHQAPELP